MRINISWVWAALLAVTFGALVLSAQQSNYHPNIAITAHPTPSGVTNFYIGVFTGDGSGLTNLPSSGPASSGSFGTTNGASTNALGFLKTDGTTNYWSFNGASVTNIPPGGVQLSAASLIGRSSAGVAQQITVGAGLTLSGTTITASGVPVGSDTQVQFDDGGAFDGDSGLTYDKVNDVLTVAGRVVTAGITNTGVTALTLAGFDANKKSISVLGSTVDSSGNVSFAGTLTGNGAGITNSITWGIVTLTDASTIAIDASLGNTFYVLLTSGVGATRIFGNPTNLKPGQSCKVFVQQSSTGNNALTFASTYGFGGAGGSVGDVTGITLTTNANRIDAFTFTYLPSYGTGTNIVTGFVRGY